LLLIAFINADGRVNYLGFVNPDRMVKPEVPKLLYVALTLKTSKKFHTPLPEQVSAFF
jgi:hypothetical protein